MKKIYTKTASSHKKKKIIIFGSGGGSRDIVDTIYDINSSFGDNYECIGFLDDDKNLWGKVVFGLKVLGPIEDAHSFSECCFVNGIYSVTKFFLNEKVIQKSKIPLNKFETIIHPSVNISTTVKIGKGSVLLRNVTLMSNVRIGKHVIIHPGAIISHDTEIDDYTFVANAVSTGGYVKVGKTCYLGLNSTLRERITLGDYTIIGMGAVVINDTLKNSIYAGNPAKFLRKSR